MILIIYPSPTKELNVNEKQFITIGDYIKDQNIQLIEDTKLENFEKYKDVKTIVVLLDNYGKFIEKYIEFIKNHKEIRFYIHENDLNKNESKLTAYNRYMLLRSQLSNLPHVYILAYYWYFYKTLYNINHSNLIMFPKFVFKRNIGEVKNNVKPKILLSGSMGRYYPMRHHIFNLHHRLVDRLDPNDNINGDQYINYLGGYLCCFTCCLTRNTPYVINKFFEIPSSGSLLLAYDYWVKEPLKQLGFIDGQNYISCTPENLVNRIQWICNSKNRNEVDRIRKNGYELVKNHHTDQIRYHFLKNLIERK